MEFTVLDMGTQPVAYVGITFKNVNSLNDLKVTMQRL